LNGARPAIEWTRILPLTSVNNFRDYGGWRTRGGAHVEKGVFFRSAHHARASAADEARIASLGIRTVVDLRRAPEQRRQPTIWLERLGLTALRSGDMVDASEHAPHILALRNAPQGGNGMRSFMIDHYRDLPFEPQHIDLFRRYFQALVHAEGGVLIHCSAGKDRTGLLAAFTHHLLQVHRDDLMEDYLLSNVAGNIDARLPTLIRGLKETYEIAVDTEGARTVLTVEPAYLASAWDAIAQRCGSIDGYIVDVLGVDGVTGDRIRARYLT